jgi:hypothetical protein
MKLKDFKEFLAKLPAECDDYDMVNGEVGFLPPEEDGEDNLVYRVDKPIIALYADTQTKEICLFHQTQDEVNDALIYNGDSN